MNPTELPDDCNDSIEPFAQDGGADIAAAEPDIADHVRMGPGSIDALRFKWTVRKESNGYFVDESIGASRSAFSTGPMPRDEVIAFIDARERDATERLEQTRQKLAAAMPIGSFALAGPRLTVKPAEPAPLLSPEHDEPEESFSFANADEADVETSSVEISDVEITVSEQATEPKEQRPEVNVDDVMDRIARLLDER